ncbi:purinergic receptor P2X, ligand-gated ion channel, 8 [Sinocyclocheilus anshuiensis]|uniref:purinergic receptor P2X, ligand-gated ion channel, 8 n=1 Tax=Sinocyclocheilus anshuiensis TaxID=1608454 RepID=UPI0007B837B9|nr:PREDICTED: P2X purinoceptor 5-like [Sinocyclocheilus anshuiensis]
MAWQNKQNRLLFLFEYTTVRYVGTQNKKIGLLYRIFQLTIMGYLIGWVFLKNKGYQVKDDTLESSVVTKVKGVARVNTTDSNLWGPEDYVFPNQGETFLSIATNFIETPNQKLGNCSENPEVLNNTCSKDEDCTVGEAVRAGNGIKTGICLETHNGTCEIYGWCPTEIHRDPDPATIVREAENFTLYIRNFIRFSQFNFSASNVPKENRSLYLKNCLYDETVCPYCPIFRLGDIVNKTGNKFEEMALKGGSIGVLIEWLCDLDADSDCRPHYSFVRLGKLSEKIGFDFSCVISKLDDVVGAELGSAVVGQQFEEQRAEHTALWGTCAQCGSAGGVENVVMLSIAINCLLRFARYFTAAGQRRRTFYKVFGIHLEIMVFGMARKFSIIPTIVNIASALTLMAAGSYICDIMLLYVMKKRSVYTESKLERMTTYVTEACLLEMLLCCVL